VSNLAMLSTHGKKPSRKRWRSATAKSLGGRGKRLKDGKMPVGGGLCWDTAGSGKKKQGKAKKNGMEERTKEGNFEVVFLGPRREETQKKGGGKKGLTRGGG